MNTTILAPATLDELAKVEGKAELIAGRIVTLMPTGRLPNLVAKRILRAMDDFVLSLGVGEVFTDNMGYAIRPPMENGRESFSPDVSYYYGPLPADEMEFIPGPPNLAVEVRSESNYGPSAELEMAEKRDDYFAAGTLVVWDVDPLGQSITRYLASNPASGTIYRRGDVADAEPALPGWRLSVDEVFPA